MITKVEIVFENCECLKLSSKDINYLSLDDIQKYAYAFLKDSFFPSELF